MPVVPGAEAFFHAGSSEVGLLLCHGFTGTPASMRPWAAHLIAETDFTVRAPRLPGHGTSWQEMNRTRWPDWYGCVRREFETLLTTCDSVYVFGQSMGGTLTLRLAQEFPEIAGLVLVNPSVLTLRRDAKLLGLISRFVPSIPGVGGDIKKPGSAELSYTRVPLRAAHSLSRLWRIVRDDLPKVTQPILLVHSTVDHVVEPENSRVVLDEVGSTDVTEVVLHDSFHVATLDNDAPLVFERSVEFVHNVQRARQVSR